MVLEIRNKQILSFFDQHPSLDAETMILKFYIKVIKFIIMTQLINNHI